MNLIDSHAHLDSPEFGEDLEAVMERAESVGIGTILTVGCLGRDSDAEGRVLALVDRFSCVFASVGVHPHDARFLDDRIETRLEDLLSHPKVIALGEIGLDFHYDFSPREAQDDAFRRQIGLALRRRRPIIVHTREAERETVRILEEFYPERGADRGILHCFSGGSELARTGLDRGFLFGLGGVLTFKKADGLRRTVAALPAERLLIETDAPYLAPVPRRGGRNEPALLRYTAEELARVRGEPVEAIAALTSRNFRRLFGLAKP